MDTLLVGVVIQMAFFVGTVILLSLNSTKFDIGVLLEGLYAHRERMERIHCENEEDEPCACERELAGYAAVDTATIWIGDPISYNQWAEKHLNKLLDMQGDPMELNTKCRKEGNAGVVIAPTGLGDGNYPVYVTRDADDRVTSATIDFTDPGWNL